MCFETRQGVTYLTNNTSYILQRKGGGGGGGEGMIERERVVADYTLESRYYKVQQNSYSKTGFGNQFTGMQTKALPHSAMIKLADKKYVYIHIV